MGRFGGWQRIVRSRHDEGEQHDLSGERPEMLAKLQSRFNAGGAKWTPPSREGRFEIINAQASGNGQLAGASMNTRGGRQGRVRHRPNRTQSSRNTMEEQQAAAVSETPAEAAPPKEQHSRKKPKRLPPYAVIVLNDDLHSFDYVIETFMKVFGYNQQKAFCWLSRSI